MLTDCAARRTAAGYTSPAGQTRCVVCAGQGGVVVYYDKAFDGGYAPPNTFSRVEVFCIEVCVEYHITRSHFSTHIFSPFGNRFCFFFLFYIKQNETTKVLFIIVCKNQSCVPQ